MIFKRLFLSCGIVCPVLSGVLFLLLRCSPHSTGNDPEGDCYRVVSPAGGSQMTIGSTFEIQWETIDGADVGEHVQIHLYRGDSLLLRITDAQRNDGTYRWYSAAASLKSGSDYRIRIADHDDPDNRYVYSQEFSVKSSSSSGNAEVFSPRTDTTYFTGTSIDIRWSNTALPGSTVVIDLYRDTVLVYRLDSQYRMKNDGQQNWDIPKFLESGDDYRIRILSLEGPNKFIYSVRFTIEGMEPDSFENDNSIRRADTSDNYLYQEHTLTENDTDWIAVQLHEGTDYIVQVLGEARTHLAMFASDTSETLFTLKTVALEQLWTRYGNITPDSTGVYFIMVRSASRQAEDRGTYTLSVISFNDTGRLDIYAPGTDTTVEAGERCSVEWDSSVVYGRYVSVYFYRDTFPLYEINDSVINTGRYSFSVPGNLESASYYHVRVAARSAPAIFGMSAAFTVEGKDPDAYEDDDTREAAVEITFDSLQEHSLYFYDSDWVTTGFSEGASYLIQVAGKADATMYLYRDGSDEVLDSVHTYRVTRIDAGYRLFTPAETGKYFICVAPDNDKTSSASYSLLITPVDESGTLNVTGPGKSDVWAAGSSYEIVWEPEKIIGYAVRLLLYEGDKRIMDIDIDTANSGRYTWKIEQTLPSGSDYSVRVEHRNEEAVFGVSERFTLSGMKPDGYEDDDMRESAQGIDADSTQSRSLTYHDTDWVNVAMDEGETYTFQTGGDAKVKGYLFAENSDSSLGSLASKGNNNTGYLSYTCHHSGTYYLQVTSFEENVNSLGAYTLSMRTGVDYGVIAVTAPAEDTVVEAGKRHVIQWDSSAIGYSYVEIQLMQGENSILSVSTKAPNNGTYSWSVPSGAASGKGYYIRVRSDRVSDMSTIFGYSRTFSIQGVPPDEYESDNSADDAKSIPVDNTVQSRTITEGDIDWSSFAAKEGHLYRIVMHGIPGSVLKLYDGSGDSLFTSQVADSTDSTVVTSWFAGSDGNALIRIEGGWGAYTLSVSEYDSTEYGFIVSAPEDGAVYSKGTALDIVWGGPLTARERVDIFLYDQDGIVETIQADTLNTGMYVWTPSVSLPAGNGYYLRIISRAHDTVFGKSGVFTLTE